MPLFAYTAEPNKCHSSVTYQGLHIFNTNTHLPLKWDGIPQGFLNISCGGPGQLCDSAEALGVERSGSSCIQKGNSDQVDQLPLDSKAQPGLVLG